MYFCRPRSHQKGKEEKRKKKNLFVFRSHELPKYFSLAFDKTRFLTVVYEILYVHRNCF